MSRSPVIVSTLLLASSTLITTTALATPPCECTRAWLNALFEESPIPPNLDIWVNPRSVDRDALRLEDADGQAVPLDIVEDEATGLLHLTVQQPLTPGGRYVFFRSANSFTEQIVATTADTTPPTFESVRFGAEPLSGACPAQIVSVMHIVNPTDDVAPIGGLLARLEITRTRDGDTATRLVPVFNELGSAIGLIEGEGWEDCITSFSQASPNDAFTVVVTLLDQAGNASAPSAPQPMPFAQVAGAGGGGICSVTALAPHTASPLGALGLLAGLLGALAVTRSRRR